MRLRLCRMTKLSVTRTIYGAQQAFSDEQDKLLEDEAQLMGVFAKTDFGHGDVDGRRGEDGLGAVRCLAGTLVVS